jgi:hypothetical protein
MQNDESMSAYNPHPFIVSEAEDFVEFIIQHSSFIIRRSCR